MTEKQYPKLPNVGPIGYASVVDIERYETRLSIGPHLPGVRDVALWTTDQMRAYADADRAVRHDELEQLCAEAYQVVGVLLDDTGQFNTEHACKILDNLSQMRRVHDDVLPWESVDMDVMRAAQAAPQPVEHPWVASDTMRADLIADLHDVFDTSGSETPQIVRDVIEYADSWLQAYIQRKAESPTQPAAPASQDAEDAARLDYLIESRAIVVSDPDSAPGYWLEFISPGADRWVQIGEYPTPRAAIDAAKGEPSCR